nr:MAG TPA: hypothetical protein [Caudoviricetes sp.]
MCTSGKRVSLSPLNQRSLLSARISWGNRSIPGSIPGGPNQYQRAAFPQAVRYFYADINFK